MPARFRKRMSFALLALIVATAAPLPAAEPGAALDLARLHGKVVLVDFWASWCKPCRQSMPWLNEMRARYGGRGLVIVGVNVDAQRADAEKFLRAVPADFDVVFDPQGTLATQYQLKGMPSSLLFARDGSLAHRRIGFKSTEAAQFEAELAHLLDTPERP